MLVSADPGFRIVPHVLQPDQIQSLVSAVEQDGLRRSRAGARHLMRLDAVRELATDDRLVQVARLALGSSPLPYRATLFDKSASANWLVAWHQDTALPLRRRIESSDWGPWTVKGGVLYAHAPATALE